MARRKNPANEFTTLWKGARAQGVNRKAIANDLGMTQGRLNDLILGRGKPPTVGELSSINDKRGATRVFYYYGGERRSFYTGMGRSYYDVMTADNALPEIIADMPPDSKPVIPGDYAIKETSALPLRSQPRGGHRINIHPLGRTLRQVTKRQ